MTRVDLSSLVVLGSFSSGVIDKRLAAYSGLLALDQVILSELDDVPVIM